MSDSLQEKIYTLIADQFSIEREKIKPTASFIDDLGADSLDMVELVMKIEEEFKFEISDQEAEKIKTVQDVVQYVDALIKEKT
jgi:acyl carrier protein